MEKVFLYGISLFETQAYQIVIRYGRIPFPPKPGSNRHINLRLLSGLSLFLMYNFVSQMSKVLSEKSAEVPFYLNYQRLTNKSHHFFLLCSAINCNFTAVLEYYK